MSDTAFVQEKLGLQPSDVWSPQTEAALKNFQQTIGVAPTGVPDVRTLAALNLYDPIAGAPSAGGGFLRDMQTATNQIPRWAWVALGLGFGGLAYFSWRRRGRGAS